VKVTELPEHVGFEDAAIDKLTGRIGFTVVIRLLEVAGLLVEQPMLDVRIQLTASPFARLEVVYVAKLLPTLAPFSNHWYAGEDPPLVGVAVKVTLDPEQMVDAEAAILTLTGKFGSTVIVSRLEVAGLPAIHDALEVNTQETTSLLASDDVV
jgi:hypothetical protein